MPTIPLPLICPRKKGSRWPCELSQDWEVSVPRLKERVATPYHFRVEALPKPAENRGATCTEWLVLDPDGAVTIRSKYGTDGCSLVPDFPKALPGCVLHDALRQATTLDPDCPWTRAEADVIFREVMADYGFNWLGRWLYYLGVAGPLGWLYSKLAAWLRPPTDRVC